MFNPFKPNGIFHSCQLEQFITVLRVVEWYFSFLFNSLYNSLKVNSRDPDQTPRSAASDLGMHCLPVSQKRTLDVYGF